MKMVVSHNELDWNRIIVIPVRNYGNSVQRNRIRRQVKEIWRNAKPLMHSGYDLHLSYIQERFQTMKSKRSNSYLFVKRLGYSFSLKVLL